MSADAEFQAEFVDDNGPKSSRRPSSDGDDRRDRAVSAVGFFAWLHKHADERYAPLKEKLGRDAQRSGIGPNFKRERILAYFDYDEALTELLTKAEMEWRADMAGKEGLKHSLEIDTSPTFDFRDPTMRKAQACRFAGEAGKRCGRPVVPGTVRCGDHGGELVDASTRRAVLLTSWLQIVDATQTAVEALVDVAAHSRNDLARVAASKEILDRAGLTAELQVSVHIEGSERTERIDRLKTRLDSMQRGLQSRAIDAVVRETAADDAVADAVHDVV